MDNSEVPGWLSSLLSEKFFNACIPHEDAKKNEKNVFCLDCCDGICPHCCYHHRSHRLLQIRRYVYHDVLRVADANKLMDCANVQSYTSNNSKVFFLNQRPQTRPPRAPVSLCITCDRNLQESSLYCSISCKVQHILRSGCRLSIYLRKCEFLDLPDPAGSEDGQATTPEPAGSLGSIGGLMECPSLSSTAGTTEVVKKKRSKAAGGSRRFRPACRPVGEISETCMVNRRKGTPQRSPLH